VALWRADAEMRPVLVAQAEVPKACITHAVFAGGGGEGGGGGAQVFFAAAADQACSIRALDEAGRCSPVQVWAGAACRGEAAGSTAPRFAGPAGSGAAGHIGV
jgi:hypothetical protein